MSTSTAIADAEVAAITRGLHRTPDEYVNYDDRPHSAPPKKTTRIGFRQRSKSIGHKPSENDLETPNNSPVSLSSNSTTSKGGRKRKSYKK